MKKLAIILLLFLGHPAAAADVPEPIKILKWCSGSGAEKVVLELSPDYGSDNINSARLTWLDDEGIVEDREPEEILVYHDRIYRPCEAKEPK